MLDSSIQLQKFSLPEPECAKLLCTLHGELDWGAGCGGVSLLCSFLSLHLIMFLYTPTSP